MSEDINHILDYHHTIVPGIIKSADEGANIGSSSQCPEEGLIQREAQGDITL